ASSHGCRPAAAGNRLTLPMDESGYFTPQLGNFSHEKTLPGRDRQIPAAPGREAFLITEMRKQPHRSCILENAPRPLDFNSSEQVESLDVLHPLDHRDAEGTPSLAVPAGDAVLRPGAEGLV